MSLILARALSRRVQLIVTLFFTWVMSSADEIQLVVAHRLHGAVVGGEGVVECLLLIRQPHLLARLGGGIEILGELDQLFDHLHRRDGTVVVGVEGFLELLGEDLALHEVALGADFEFVLEQLLQQLGGDVLVRP